MLVVSMEAGLGECKGRIQIGVPYAAVDTAHPSILSEHGDDDKPGPVRTASSCRGWNGTPVLMSLRPRHRGVGGMEMTAARFWR